MPGLTPRAVEPGEEGQGLEEVPENDDLRGMKQRAGANEGGWCWGFQWSVCDC